MGGNVIWICWIKRIFLITDFVKGVPTCRVIFGSGVLKNIPEAMAWRIKDKFLMKTGYGDMEILLMEREMLFFLF